MSHNIIIGIYDSEVVDQLENINLNQSDSQLISEGPVEPRPSHPADPDNRGLPDIQTDPLRLEVILMFYF